MCSKVCLVRVPRSFQTLKDSVSHAIVGTGFRLVSSVKTAVIKPNLCYYWNSSTGNTTDPKLVAEVAEYRELMKNVKSVGNEFAELLSELGKLKTESTKPKKPIA